MAAYTHESVEHEIEYKCAYASMARVSSKLRSPVAGLLILSDTDLCCADYVAVTRRCESDHQTELRFRILNNRNTRDSMQSSSQHNDAHKKQGCCCRISQTKSIRLFVADLFSDGGRWCPCRACRALVLVGRRTDKLAEGVQISIHKGNVHHFSRH